MFRKKGPDNVELLALIISKMTKDLGACRTREELTAYLKMENARPQHEHDAEMCEIIRQAREDMAKLTHIY